MGKDRAAEAKAAEARETARQFDELRARAEEESYDVDSVLANLKAASEEMPELVGLYEAIERDPSALEDVATDPRLAEIQKGNLEAMQSMAEESGFSEEDLAKRRQLQRDVANDDSARQKAIIQSMAQRGQSGSGAELLARLKSSQDSAQSQSEASDRLAVDSANARRAALQSATQAAQSLRGQDYSEQSNLATARDQISAFNALNRQNVNTQNLQLRQGLENQKSAQAQQYYTNAANTEQQRFSNEMSKLGFQSNTVANAGQAAQAGVAPKSNVGGIVGSVVGAGIGGALSGSPQGVTAGSSVGGAVGSLFNKGGIKGLASEQMEGRQAEADYSNRGLNGYQKMTRGERPTRSTSESFNTLLDKLKPKVEDESLAGDSLFDNPDNAEVFRDDLGVDKINGKSTKKTDMLGIMSAMAGSLGGPSKNSPKQMVPKYSQQNVKVNSLDKFTAEDGGVKPLELDEMRDDLLRQVNAFADGGVNYSDERLLEVSDNRNRLLKQIEENKEMGNLRANAELLKKLDPLEKEMVTNIEKGLHYNDGGMAYNDGGEGTIIESGKESYEGDLLEDRINDGEMVLNVEQQDRLNDALIELKRLKSKERTDKLLQDGKAEINPNQQESIMAFVRGEIDVDEVPNDRVVKEPNITEPTGSMAELLNMLSKKKR